MGKKYLSMISFKDSFQPFLILSAVWISFTCAPPKPIPITDLQKCKDIMTIVFIDPKTSPLLCVQFALRKMLLHNYLYKIYARLDNDNDDVSEFTKSFYSHIYAEKILVPSKYCYEMIRVQNISIISENEKEEEYQKCLGELRGFGSYSYNKIEYQYSIVYHALHYFRQIDAFQESSFLNSPYCYLPRTYGYRYMDHLADAIKLKKSNVQDKGNENDEENVEIEKNVKPLQNPEDFCQEKYGPNEAGPSNPSSNQIQTNKFDLTFVMNDEMVN